MLIERGICDQAEGEGYIKQFIATLVECLIVSVNCQDLQDWVQEPLPELVQAGRVTMIGKKVAL
jgi:hypothetical protein